MFREVYEVVRNGQVLATFSDEQEAKMYAACRFTGPEVVRMRLVATEELQRRLAAGKE